MEIYILDSTTLDRLGTVDEYESFIWNTSYNGIGSFELRCSMNFFGLLKTERLVQCSEDDNHNGVIESVLKITEDDGHETLQIKGRMAEVLLDRRIITGNYAYQSMQPAEIAADLITKHAIDSRPVENLQIGNLVEAPEGVTDYAGSNKSLLTEVQAICQAENLGFNLRADSDNKRLIFDTYIGVNRTEDDNTVTSIIENDANNTLVNGLFADGFTGWTQINNERGIDEENGSYISDYPLLNTDGVISKSKVYSMIEVPVTNPETGDVVLDAEGNAVVTYEKQWQPSPYMRQTVNLNSEHVYFIAASAKNPLAAVLSFGLQEVLLNFETSGYFVKKGCFFVPETSGAHTFVAGLGELPEKEGQYAYWDNCIVLDLTATFGAGQEPSLDWCMENIYYSGNTLKYKTQIIEFVENTVTPLVFSRDRDTLVAAEYEKNITNERNYVYIKGADDFSTFIMAGDEAETGLKLKEVFLDLSNIQRTLNGVELPEVSYTAMLRNNAKATLRQLVVNEIIDGTLYKLSNKKFGTDFYLGDICTFADDKMGLRVSLRISAVQQVWDTNGHAVSVTLGDDIPTIYETIKLVTKGAK